MDKDRFDWLMHWLYNADLTEWERNFIESVDIQYEQKGELTERQEEILEKIYREKG